MIKKVCWGGGSGNQPVLFKKKGEGLNPLTYALWLLWFVFFWFWSFLGNHCGKIWKMVKPRLFRVSFRESIDTYRPAWWILFPCWSVLSFFWWLRMKKVADKMTLFSESMLLCWKQSSISCKRSNVFTRYGAFFFIPLDSSFSMTNFDSTHFFGSLKL